MPKATGDPGFILLTSVWLLVLGGAIAAAVMLNARTAVRSVKAAEQQALGSQALLSARDQVIADLIERGRFSRWAESRSSGSITVADDVTVDVQVSQEGGRLDLLSAQKHHIDALFAALDVSSAAREPARTSLEGLRKQAESGRRPIQSMMALSGLAGWTSGVMACLLPLVTIHSAMPSPSPSAVPLPLTHILDIQQIRDEGGVVDTQYIAGELYRIETTARLPHNVARSAWMVRITGDLRQPFWILGTYPGGLPDAPKTGCFKPQRPL